jgi:hypothetical protein
MAIKLYQGANESWAGAVELGSGIELSENADGLPKLDVSAAGGGGGNPWKLREAMPLDSLTGWTAEDGNAWSLSNGVFRSPNADNLHSLRRDVRVDGGAALLVEVEARFTKAPTANGEFGPALMLGLGGNTTTGMPKVRLNYNTGPGAMQAVIRTWAGTNFGTTTVSDVGIGTWFKLRGYWSGDSFSAWVNNTRLPTIRVERATTAVILETVKLNVSSAAECEFRNLKLYSIAAPWEATSSGEGGGGSGVNVQTDTQSASLATTLSFTGAALTNVGGLATLSYDGRFLRLTGAGSQEVAGRIRLTADDALHVGITTGVSTGSFNGRITFLGSGVSNYQIAHVAGEGLYILNASSTFTPAKTVQANLYAQNFITNNAFYGRDADTVTVPSFTWFADNNTGMYRAAEDQIGFTTGGAVAARISGTLLESLVPMQAHGYIREGTGTLGNMNALWVRNIAQYNGAASAVGALVISTGIASANAVMLRLRITGYLHSSTFGNIHTEVTCYASAGSVTTLGTVSLGTYTFPVRVARDSNANAVVILGDVDSSWNWAKVHVDAMLGHSGSAVAGLAWTTTLVTDLSAYTGITTAPERLTLMGAQHVARTTQNTVTYEQQFSSSRTNHQGVAQFMDMANISLDNIFHEATANTFTDLSHLREGNTGAASVNVLSTTNAHLYFGDSVTFQEVFVQTSNAMAGGTLVWEYWNGSAWTAFTATASTGANFSASAYYGWPALTGWATTTVNGVSKFWVRVRTTTTPSSALLLTWANTSNFSGQYLFCRTHGLTRFYVTAQGHIYTAGRIYPGNITATGLNSVTNTTRYFYDDGTNLGFVGSVTLATGSLLMGSNVFVDASRNVTAGTITASGALTTVGAIRTNSGSIGLTAGGYVLFSTTAASFLDTGTAALPLYTGGVLASANYSDSVHLPPQGIYSSGAVSVGMPSMASYVRLGVRGGIIQHEYSASAGARYGFFVGTDSTYLCANAYFDGSWRSLISGRAAVLQVSPGAGTALSLYSNIASGVGALWTPVEIAYITTGGAVYASSFFETSSRELKEDIRRFDENALDLLDKLEIVSFRRKMDERKHRHIGIVAEDTAAATGTVFTGPDENAFDLANAVGVLVRAVQELREESRALRSRVEGR